MFGVNESAVQTIKKSKKSIWEAVQASAPVTANVSHYATDKHIIKMEYALFIWMERSHKLGAPVDSNLIQEKALSLVNMMCDADGGEDTSSSSDAPQFTASKGWFENFKRRFSCQD